MNDRVEFLTKRGDTISGVRSSHSPAVGEEVVIRQKRYIVVQRGHTLDYADQTYDRRSLVCWVVIEEKKK